MEIRNESDYDFTDISSEQYREYVFDGGNVRIEEPTHLAVSDSGHRVLDEEGQSHYVPYGWREIVWKVHEGEPHFVK